MTRLFVTDIARLLNVSRVRVHQLRRHHDFPEPLGESGGRHFWGEVSVLRWAAAAGRDLSERAPALWRPAVDADPPEFVGARVTQGYALFSWVTSDGIVGLGYPAAHRGLPHPHQILDAAPSLTTAISVRATWNHWGPELQAIDRSAPDRLYEPRWVDLERVLAGPAPWWPTALRKLDEMIRWTPGSPPRQVVAVPMSDVDPLLRIAADAPDASPIAVVMTSRARTLQSLATDAADRDVVDLSRAEDRDAIALAAEPAPTRAATDEPASDLRRRAWAEVLDRSDTLAEQCVSSAMLWDGGVDFPFVTFRSITVDHAVAAEWVARLEPAPRTAAFAVFDDDVRATLVDPVTNLPAVNTVDDLYWAAVPPALPAQAPLAEVILAGAAVWVRTADNVVLPAPEQHGRGHSFGYNGSGPATLAALIDRLLDDAGSPAPGPWEDRHPSPGLLAGASGGWSDGAVLTQGDLLAAQNSAR